LWKQYGTDRRVGRDEKSNFFLQLLILAFVGISLLFYGQVEATSRGIRGISEKGKELYLYKDYHALVIGVSAYSCLLIGQEITKQQPLKLHI
jgi:hypothetical protein